MADLSTLFDPERVAVVGATEREGSVGRALMENLQSFEGDVVPVNPSHDVVFGQAAADVIGDVPDVDVAVVAVPVEAAVDVVRDAAAANVDNVVVVTAGFAESGSEGAVRERELTAVAAEHDLNLVGPNSLGIIATPAGLNATFGPVDAVPGNVSFMSQSGAFVTAVLDWAIDADVGFRHVVSLGNKAVLDERDFVSHWGGDPETDVILGYLESVEAGRAFVDAARAVTADTPVVLVKSGRTEAGAGAAASHTGAIAGSERAYEAGLEQAGIIRARTVQELFDYASVLEDQPVPGDGGVAIVTNAGGPGVMATDTVGDTTLSLASFGDATIERLRESLPPAASVYNPVDLVGDASVERFQAALDAVLADPAVATAVVIAAPTATLSFPPLADVIAGMGAKHHKPVTASLMGGVSTREAEERLRTAGVPTYFDPARAVGAMDALARYRRISQREYPEPTQFDVDRDRAAEILAHAAERGRTRLGVEAMELLAAYGIETPAGEVAPSPGRARELATDLPGPAVLKLVSPDILHKTDIGGVKVGVAPEDVAAAYEDLVTRAYNYQPDAEVLGVLVQEQVDTDAGVETIVGTSRDPQFGPLVLFGLGGIFVEVLEDTAVRVAPVAEPEAAEMVEEIRAAPLLRGVRGRSPVDRTAIVEVIQRLSQLVDDFPAIMELDINPLVATPDGATAIDLRLTIDPETL